LLEKEYLVFLECHQCLHAVEFPVLTKEQIAIPFITGGDD